MRKGRLGGVGIPPGAGPASSTAGTTRAGSGGSPVMPTRLIAAGEAVHSPATGLRAKMKVPCRTISAHTVRETGGVRVRAVPDASGRRSCPPPSSRDPCRGDELQQPAAIAPDRRRGCSRPRTVEHWSPGPCLRLCGARPPTGLPARRSRGCTGVRRLAGHGRRPPGRRLPR